MLVASKLNMRGIKKRAKRNTSSHVHKNVVKKKKKTLLEVTCCLIRRQRGQLVRVLELKSARPDFNPLPKR